MLAAGDIISLLLSALYSSDATYSSVGIGVGGPICIVKFGTFGSRTCAIGCIWGGTGCIMLPSSSWGINSTDSGLNSTESGLYMVGGCHKPGCITGSSVGCCGFWSSPLSSYIGYSDGYIVGYITPGAYPYIGAEYIGTGKIGVPVACCADG